MSSTYGVTGLQYTYGNATLSADYVGYLYLHNYWFTPHIQASNPEDSLCWLGLPRESMAYTNLVGAPPQVEPMLVTSTFRITGFRFTYGCPGLSAAFIVRSAYRIS